MGEPPFSVPRLSRRVLGAATLCVAAAVGLSSLLAWHALAGPSLAVGCGGAADCGTITATRWAFWGPAPIILPAVLLYAIMLGGLLVLEPLRAARYVRRERVVWTGLATLSLVVLGATLWFVGVQGFVLRRYCPFCLATHLCASLGSLLTLRAVPRNFPGAERRWWLFPATTAACLLTMLVGGQLLLPFTSSPALAPVSFAALPANVFSWALPARDLVLASGKVHLDAGAYPVLAGSSAPTHFVAVLFDYTCEACRTNHGLLTAAVGRSGGKLALVLVPTPLDPACNPAIARLRPEHVNACLYARYALVVWKAAPEKFATYDAWLMAGGSSQPPPIDEARRQAETLVGAVAFQRTLATPGPDQSLHQAGKIYQTLEAGEIPKLLLPRAVLSGSFGSPTQLDQTFKAQFGLQTPAVH